jgi:hypothetical protein
MHPLPSIFVIPPTSEFGNVGEGALVIGKVESYQTILSQSQRSIYTEVGLRVQRVFGHPVAPVQAGQLIFIDRPGGTVTAPSGKVISNPLLKPESMGLQPDHTYLIRVGYDESGHFYTAGYKESAMWDVTDGTVKPGNAYQRSRAEHGLSEINGMSVDALTQFLDDKFQNFYNEGGRSK